MSQGSSKSRTQRPKESDWDALVQLSCVELHERKKALPEGVPSDLLSNANVLMLCSTLRSGVVLFVIDIPRRTILFAVYLGLFSGCKFPAVRCAISPYLLVYPALLIFQLRGFASG